MEFVKNVKLKEMNNDTNVWVDNKGRTIEINTMSIKWLNNIRKKFSGTEKVKPILNEIKRRRMNKELKIQQMLNFDQKIKRHPKCLGDGIDDCGYLTKISCDDCKYNNWAYGNKDPEAKCNAE